jgi:hypothetical protein
MSRRVFLLGIGIAAVALAFAVTDTIIGPAPGVTAANARRIRPGMKLREVEAILGARGGWIGGDTASTIFGPERYRWTGPDAEVTVVFTSGGLAGSDWHAPRVVANGVTFARDEFPHHLLVRPSLRERLRSWLGW